MPDPIQLIPLAEIDATALTRDRTGLDPEPQAELEASIAASGLRQPIELFPLDQARGPARFGLLSGFRRLHAFRTLHAATAEDRYATIPAFLRERTSLAAALAAMVEENEIRAGLSPFERGLIAVTARNQGAFPSIEEAIDGLYPNASRFKRGRLRAMAFLAEEMAGQFTADRPAMEQDHVHPEAGEAHPLTVDDAEQLQGNVVGCQHAVVLAQRHQCLLRQCDKLGSILEAQDLLVTVLAQEVLALDHLCVGGDQGPGMQLRTPGVHRLAG